MTLWRFPWREPGPGAYDTDGPKERVAFTLDGCDLVVSPTALTGIDSGRGRFRVECLTHDWLIHRATTGPSSWIKAHLRDPSMRPAYGKRLTGSSIPETEET